MCLLKSVICCVRVSNHVPCRRVALLASRSARCGAGADVFWVCRLQCRHADAAIAKQFLQSFCIATGSYRLGAGACGRAPRTAAIFPPASALPVAALAAADRGTAILSERAFRRVRGRARTGLLHAADASAAGDDGHRRPALGRGRPRAGSGIGASRHHDHRRHQRHARYLVAPLQRVLRRDPAGQWLQGAARAVARPATDHSAPDRDRRCACTGRRCACKQARCGGRIDGSCRQSRRHLAQHRTSQQGERG